MNVPIEHIKTLFPTNLELIIQFNKELLAQLEERINNFTPMTSIGDVFMKLVREYWGNISYTRERLIYITVTVPVLEDVQRVLECLSNSAEYVQSTAKR